MVSHHPDDPWLWALARAPHLQHIPAVADIVRDDSPLVIIQKSAQVGLTEALILKALWGAATNQGNRGTVLFLMPHQNQMDDFSQDRFDRLIERCPDLAGFTRPEPPARRAANRLRLKQFGCGSIYLRGADSRKQIASVSADLVILDEFDQMTDGVLDLARKRVASSRSPQIILSSTPGVPEAGINAMLLLSDQRRYFIPCPACSLPQFLLWKENVDLERQLVVCRACRAEMDRSAPGAWIAQAPGNEYHGYLLNRLYSPWLDLEKMIEASKATTWSATQEFRRSDLGEPYVPEGGGLQLADLDAARADYALTDYGGQATAIGIDVGKQLHVVIRELVPFKPDRKTLVRRQVGVSRLWFAGQVGWDDLPQLLSKYNVQKLAIDAQPEYRKAVELVVGFRKGGFVVEYEQLGHMEEMKQSKRRNEPSICKADRLIALDETFERFRTRLVELPRNARELGGAVKDGMGEYYREMRALQRESVQDAQGNWTTRWLDYNKPDHYAHAELYCLLASRYRPSSITYTRS